MDAYKANIYKDILHEQKATKQEVRTIPDEQIAQILVFYARVYPDGDIQWSALFYKLTNVQKIYVYFLLLRALCVSDRITSERATPDQIAKAIQVTGNSVRPMLKHLRDKKRSPVLYDPKTHEYLLMDFDRAINLVKPS